MFEVQKCFEPMERIKKERSKLELKKMTMTALFAALCAVGGYIKIPSGIGSLALDTVPALLAATVLPPAFAGTAALLGHTASALYAGFPLGPFHVLIAFEMLAIVYVFAKLHNGNHPIGKWVFFVSANGILAPLPFYFLISPAFFWGALPVIILATVVNGLIAAIIMPILQQVFQRRMGFLR